ncbi:MAG: YIP1 family protein [Dehalococcoidia bacterium]|nr:YIP1 family protein [Dehalococcoidia bacterium]
MRGVTAKHSFTERVILAAKLDPGVYEEVEHDTGATGQALLVVLLSSIASGVGVLALGPLAIPAFALFSLVIWGVYLGVIYLVGATLFAAADTRCDWGELTRTLGFARAPGFLLVFAFIPIAGVVIGVVVSLWGLAATVIAIRQALDFSTGRAIATALVAAVVHAALQLILFVAL